MKTGSSDCDLESVFLFFFFIDEFNVLIISTIKWRNFEKLKSIWKGNKSIRKGII